MKIFITGVAGFLGSHLARSFRDDGHSVVGCDSLIGGELENVPEGVEFHRGDCCDFSLMQRISQGCELVYHCAATAYEGLSVFSPSLISQNILGGSASVYSAAIANGAKRIVFCSSMARYGSSAIPFVESMACKPDTPYGIAKVAAEDVLRALGETHGIEWVIAVPHNIIGPGQKYDDPYRNVAAIMINLMLQGRQPIIYGDGSQRRCFSFVDDCLFCLRELGRSKDVIGEVVNIGPDEEFVAIKDLAEEIANLLEFDLDPIFVAPRPCEVRDAICSSDKARQLFGYETGVSLRDGLRHMIEDIRKRGPRQFAYHLDLEIVTDLAPQTWRDRLF